jgi:hypothetical protein
MTLRPEMQPFILVRIVHGQAECATWQVQNGGKALALFSSRETAEQYQRMVGLFSDWKIVRPPRIGLLELLRAGHSQGVGLAVIDPTQERAEQAVSIAEILLAVDSIGGSSGSPA